MSILPVKQDHSQEAEIGCKGTVAYFRFFCPVCGKRGVWHRQVTADYAADPRLWHVRERHWQTCADHAAEQQESADARRDFEEDR